MNQTAPVLTPEKQNYCCKSCFRSFLGGYNLDGPVQYHLLMILIYFVTVLQTFCIAYFVESYIVTLIVPATINALIMIATNFINTEYHPRKNFQQMKHLLMATIPQTIATSSAIHYEGGVIDLIVFLFLFPREQSVELGFTEPELYSRSRYAILFLKVILILTHTGHMNIANIIRYIYFFTPIMFFIGLYGQFTQFAEYILELINFLLGSSNCYTLTRTGKLFLMNIAAGFILAGLTYTELNVVPMIIAGLFANAKIFNILGECPQVENQLYRSNNVNRKQTSIDIIQLIANMIVIIIFALAAKDQYEILFYITIPLNVLLFLSYHLKYVEYTKMLVCLLQNAFIATLNYPLTGIFGMRFFHSLGVLRLYSLTHTNLFELFVEQIVCIIVASQTEQNMAEWLLWGWIVQICVRTLIRLRTRAKLWYIANHTMLTIRKQKVQTARTITLSQILLFPVTLAILIISCVLDAPYMPILGLPIYSFASLRPYRNWPQISKYIQGSAEASIYNAFLNQSFQELLGKFPIWNHYLLRIGKYIGVIQILEQSSGYAIIQFKGMESQETTSCHGVEAREIDRLVEESDWRSAISLLKRFKVNSYEENQIILTGIIEAEDFVQGFKQIFMKILCIFAYQELNETHILSIKSLAKEFDGSQTFFPDVFSEQLKLPQKFNMKEEAPPQQLPEQKVSIRHNDDDLMGMLDSFNEPKKQRNNSTIYESLKRALLIMYQISLEDLSFTLNRLNQKQLFEVFNNPKFLQQKRQFQDLEPVFSEIVTKAMRKALRLSVEFYSIEGTLQIEDTQIIEETKLNDVYVGMGMDVEWGMAMQRKQQLWSLGYDSGKNKLTVYRQQFQVQECQMFKFCSEVVRGIEANLQMELLFVTNDDEERYSIQTHELFFRNMIIEGSELPLGYAPFYSGPVMISLR